MNGNLIWTQSGFFFFQNQDIFFYFQNRAGEASPFPPSSTPVSVAEYALISLKIPKYPWECLNKLFWLCQGSEYTWLSYIFDRLLKMYQVLNVAGFWIWHGCICRGYTQFWICLNIAQYASIMSEYASIMPGYTLMSLNMPEHGWILLNVPEFAWKWLNKLFWLCQGSQHALSS